MELTPFAPAVVSPGKIPAIEAATVSRALGCPDLFLFECSESAVRERFILHVVRAAAERGERFLIISPDPAAADRLVEALAADRTLRTVRALSDDENPLRPSATVSRLTSAGAGANRAEQLRREAAQTIASLEAKLAGLDRSREYHAKLETIESERQIVLTRLSRVEEEVRVSLPDSSTRCREIQAERDAILAKRAELERVPTPKSGILARLFGFGKSPAVAQHSQELTALTERDAALAAECAAVSEEAEKRFAEQIARQRSTLSQRLSELDGESAGVDAALLKLHPQAASEDTVENGSPSRNTQSELERELAVARTRQQELIAAGAELPRRLLTETQIVVGTPGCVECDPVFAALGSVPFDRLILDHGEELNEAAFDRFAALASKWILAGDAGPPPIPNGRPPRGRTIEASLFSRLAKLCDREPWRIDGDRLIVRLVHLTAKQRAELVREPLLDHPDVELGVVNVNGEPILAEIAFPGTTAIPAAKSFLVSQLGEVVIRTCGEPNWQTSADALTANWPHFANGEGEWIELESGIRERIAASGPMAFTAAIAFDSASWDEAAAKEWVSARASASVNRLAVLPCERAVRGPAFTSH